MLEDHTRSIIVSFIPYMAARLDYFPAMCNPANGYFYVVEITCPPVVFNNCLII